MLLRSVLAAGLVGGLVLALGSPAEAAKKRPYVVTVSAIASKADVGQTLTFSGKVTGRLAAKKSVRLQRRVGTGAWVNAASTRTTRKGTYTLRTKVATAGTQSFRVYAPPSRKARAGVSVARSIVGWRWLYFAQQSVQITSYGNDSSNWIYSGTFATADGLRHPNSYRLNLNPGNSVGINALPDGCDRLAATISTPASSGPVRLVVNAVSPAQDLVLSAGANQLLNLPLNPAYYEAGLWLRATGPIAEPVVAEPRMHCSVNALKSY